MLDIFTVYHNKMASGKSMMSCEDVSIHSLNDMNGLNMNGIGPFTAKVNLTQYYDENRPSSPAMLARS